MLIFRLKIFRIRPLQGGRGIRTTRNGKGLPGCIAHKKACLTVECGEGKCFVYACLAHLHPNTHNPRSHRYYERYMYELNLKGLTFPMRLKHVQLFERNNPTISVNVLGWETKSGIIP